MLDKIRALWARARARWKRPECRAAPYALASAAAVVLLNNRKLFSLLGGRLDFLTLSGLACAATILLTLTGMVALVFLVLGGRASMKPLVVASLLLSATLAYFTGELGTVFDLGMVRNIADAFSDRNTLEASELLSLPLAGRLFLCGVLPSALALLPRITYGTFRAELRSRAAWAGALALLWIVFTLPNYRYLSYFSRENHALRYYATPTFALNSLRKYVASSWFGGQEPFREIGADAARGKAGRARTVGVLVVGETARADHFSLNGYPRKTNPRLELRSLFNYPEARARGTSTTYCVPYMFSFLGKKEFTTERASRQSNVLDVLARAGVQVVWIDNNSGPKGVCDRVGYVDFRSGADRASPFYGELGYYDEVLVDAVKSRVRKTDDDVLIVLHTMGSHGPAYYRRYPPAFEAFAPSCKESSPQRGPQDQIINAYDNTILYTDYVVDRLIAALEELGEPAFLVYASDHGESLGENGVYLHGLPDSLAPDAQIHVPMLAWLSDPLLAGRDVPRLRARAAEPSSHDNLPHTMLGLFQVRTSLYREDLDLLK